MRILTFTTLYPNRENPAHGVFVENRLKAFAEHSGAEIKVIAPIPWFPLGHKMFGRYGAYHRVQDIETDRAFETSHPRYFIPPKIGMTYAAGSLERCFLQEAQRLIDEGWDFDLIDAHYYYPDGVAAARVAKALGKPLVITARGTDINLLPQYPKQRSMILDAAKTADASITVAGALKDEMVKLGAHGEKIHVMRNGVDLDFFQPLDRAAIRAEMDLDGPVIASVGHLIERKGHDLVIDALKSLPAATLLIAGDGEERKNLEAQAASLGLTSRVRFLGPIPHEKLAEIYNAADILVLASSREGWPNVLLEAMACGTPVVATPVWGSGEVITAAEAGVLCATRSTSAIVDAVKTLLIEPPARADTRIYAEKFSWEETSKNLEALFSTVISNDQVAKKARVEPVIWPTRRGEDQSYRPRMIVTIDTEEQFDWASYGSSDFTVAPPEDIARFQALCAIREIRPLYFLTHPMLEDKANTDFFKMLAEFSTADFGLHLHHWVTPPDRGFDTPYYSYQTNLPADLHLLKLARLAELFEKTFGFCATSHRAGRYGIGAKDYGPLRDVGVVYDFSPSVGFDFSAEGGPDFSGHSNMPFTVEPAGGGKIFVTPVSGALAIKRTPLVTSFPAPPGFAAPRPIKANHIPVRLSPEGAKLIELQSLAKRLVKDHCPVLTYSLHSTTLTPGANPYAPSAAAVDKLIETTSLFFDYFENELDGEFISLDGLGGAYATAAGEAQISSLTAR